MVYVRSRKFCCCLPVRFGLFCISILGIIGGGLVSVGGWLQIKQLREFICFIGLRFANWIMLYLQLNTRSTIAMKLHCGFKQLCTHCWRFCHYSGRSQNGLQQIMKNALTFYLGSLIGVFNKSRTLVSLYSTMLNSHLGVLDCLVWGGGGRRLSSVCVRCLF